jgi:DNA invertase Pin-like site-specific DNA recombinase
MKAVAYTRVSTIGQAEKGVSLEDQKQKIKQYADLYGFSVTEFITDGGESAKNLNRPGVQRILSMMKQQEIEVVIVAKLDRLTRSVRDLADIVELANHKNVSLISVNEHIDTGTAAGRMILNMLGVISQWERETIGERTQTALEYKKSTGKAYNGVSLYGYTNCRGSLILDQKEQEIIAVVMNLNEEKHSVSDICRMLEEKGFRTRCGKTKWHSKVVKKIIEDSGLREKIESAQINAVAA